MNNIALGFALRGVLFMISFVIFAVLFAKLYRVFLSKIPSGADQVLGGIYGVMKSLLIFGVINSIAVNIYSLGKKEKPLPEMVTSAWFYDAIKATSSLVDPMISGMIKGVVGKSAKDLGNKVKEAEKVVEKGEETMKKAASATDDTGYNIKDIQQKNDLMNMIK